VDDLRKIMAWALNEENLRFDFSLNCTMGHMGRCPDSVSAEILCLNETLPWLVCPFAVDICQESLIRVIDSGVGRNPHNLARFHGVTSMPLPLRSSRVLRELVVTSRQT